jgi:hypothetical protein
VWKLKATESKSEYKNTIITWYSQKDRADSKTEHTERQKDRKIETKTSKGNIK